MLTFFENKILHFAKCEFSSDWKKTQALFFFFNVPYLFIYFKWELQWDEVYFCTSLLITVTFSNVQISFSETLLRFAWIWIQKYSQLSEHMSIFAFCVLFSVFILFKLVRVFYMLPISWFVSFLYIRYMFLFLPSVQNKRHAMSVSSEVKSQFSRIAAFFCMLHNDHFQKVFHVTKLWPTLLYASARLLILSKEKPWLQVFVWKDSCIWPGSGKSLRHPFLSIQLLS